MLKLVNIYTDGACSGNPGGGGWAAVLDYMGHEKVLCGGDAPTTNNRMELTAVIEALAALNERCSVVVYSDSKYVVDAVEKGWARSWRQHDWIKSDKKPALNADLWQRLLELADYHKVRFEWIKGHNEHPQNERCDKLAVEQSKKYSK